MAEQKTILITGCSSGIGLSAAVYLASKGYHVFATMRDVNKKGPLLEQAGQAGIDIPVLPLDVTDPASIQSAVDHILQKDGRIDICINNAGYILGGFFEDLSQNEIQYQMDTNFFGVQNVTRAVLPSMRKNKMGKIINVSSVYGLISSPAFGAYIASKWALEGFTESLFYELKMFGIKVCLVEPGVFPTQAMAANYRQAGQSLNEGSPYYALSNKIFPSARTSAGLSKNNLKDVACTVEHLIRQSNPPLRTIVGRKGQLLLFLRKVCPLNFWTDLRSRRFEKAFMD